MQAIKINELSASAADVTNFGGVFGMSIDDLEKNITVIQGMNPVTASNDHMITAMAEGNFDLKDMIAAAKAGFDGKVPTTLRSPTAIASRTASHQGTTPLKVGADKSRTMSCPRVIFKLGL